MRKVIIVGGAALALLLAGCGGGNNPNVASISSPNTTSSKAPAPGGGNQGKGDYQDAFRKYAKCMRDNGYNMPDPVGDDAVPGINPNDPKYDSAAKACKQLEPPAPEDQNDPALQDKMRKYASCMREHGVDVKDPGPGEGMALPNGDDPKVVAAAKICSPNLG